MEGYPILDKLNGLEDLRGLSGWELERLCYEIRSFLIDHVSRTGGHLASNLGAVELTVALHRVFHSPEDSIVWDVGHQSYTHKILTGRKDRFDTLRQPGGLSGFPKPHESVHDAFVAGHASTSVSAACGIAAANRLSGNGHTAVAVVGDGAFTGGMIYEAINNVDPAARLVIVLNHNDMSISKNVGAFARYLSTIRAKPGYLHLKERIENLLEHIPLVGLPLERAIRSSKSVLKYILYHNTFFEEMGLYYIGPVDGHNLRELEDALTQARDLGQPSVVQVETVKGKGYEFAERNPPAYHGVSRFDVCTGTFGSSPAPAGPTFSSTFGAEIERLGVRDPRICAITAAMKLGTGLDGFSRSCPGRFFDVGIAEEHAVTFAAGLATKGYIPVFAVYSTFLQRSFDQVLHDAALEKTHIVLAVDRAGIGRDAGGTHQGVFDVPMLTCIPGVTIYSPAGFDSLREDLRRALYEEEGVVAVRYPRGGEGDHCPFGPGEDDVWVDGDRRLTVIAYGRTASALWQACQKLETPPEQVYLNKIWPLSDEMLNVLARRERILMFEESVLSGSIAEHLLSALNRLGFPGEYRMVTLPDAFIPQCSVPEALDRFGLSTGAMEKRVRQEMEGLK